MEDNKSIMPCPNCPPDCPRQSLTCKPLCKVWKEWHKEHDPPRPKVTVAEKYRNEMNKKVKGKKIKIKKRGEPSMKGKHWVCCVRNFPDCPCVSCVHDNQGESEEPCCDKHCIFCTAKAKCPDYQREDK